MEARTKRTTWGLFRKFRWGFNVSRTEIQIYQTSDNMGRWKSRGGKSQRREGKRREEKRKNRKKEDAGARKSSKVAIHCVLTELFMFNRNPKKKQLQKQTPAPRAAAAAFLTILSQNKIQMRCVHPKGRIQLNI